MIMIIFFIIFNPSLRDELANIENRILEKKIADKKKEELRKKNIAVSKGNPPKNQYRSKWY